MPAPPMMPTQRIINCTGAIIAGGKSVRMGRDKAFLRIGEETLIERQIALLRGVFGGVLISANEPDKFAPFGVPAFADRLPGLAPLLGIHTMLLESREEWICAVACDMPFLDEEFLAHLASLREGVDAVVPYREGFPEPLHAFYHRRCAEAIEAQWRSGDLKIARFYDRVRMRRFDLEGTTWEARGTRSLVNVNTPEDLARYLRPPTA